MFKFQPNLELKEAQEKYSLESEINQMFNDYQDSHTFERFSPAPIAEATAITEFFRVGVPIEEPHEKWQADWRFNRLKRDEHCAHLELTIPNFIFGLSKKEKKQLAL